MNKNYVVFVEVSNGIYFVKEESERFYTEKYLTYEQVISALNDNEIKVVIEDKDGNVKWIKEITE